MASILRARDEAPLNGSYPDLTQAPPAWEGTTRPSTHKEERSMSSTKLKRTLALALAGGSLAIGVPAALAASGGGDAAPAPAPASSFIQDEGEQARPDREDCPEKDGRNGGEGEGSSAEQGDSTAEPSV
jgi:hypothetical protein